MVRRKSAVRKVAVKKAPVKKAPAKPKAAIQVNGLVVTVNCKSKEESSLVVTKVAKAMKKATRRGEEIRVEVK